MKKHVLIAAVIAAVSAWSDSALAADGTAAEARAMLVRAMNEVRINQTAALAKFNRNDGGFVDRDLYVFCANGGDGKTVAHVDKQLIGRDVRSFRDVAGYAFGDAMYRDARQNVIKTFRYLWTRPGDTKPVPKESYVMRLGGIVCGVGYYK